MIAIAGFVGTLIVFARKDGMKEQRIIQLEQTVVELKIENKEIIEQANVQVNENIKTNTKLDLLLTHFGIIEPVR